MTTELHAEQSRAEDQIYGLDFLPQLLSTVTLVSPGAVVTHIPPSGSPLTITPSLVGTLVHVPIPKNLVLGVHKFSCVAITTSSQLKPEMLLVITVLR